MFKGEGAFHAIFVPKTGWRYERMSSEMVRPLHVWVKVRCPCKTMRGLGSVLVHASFHNVGVQTLQPGIHIEGPAHEFWSKLAHLPRCLTFWTA